MKDVPKIDCTLSGFPGFSKHLEPPYARWVIKVVMLPINVLFAASKGVWSFSRASTVLLISA